MLFDQLSRPLRDLRISVTDRCNFRCTYCMPREVFGPDHAYLPHKDVLSFEEISRVAGLLVQTGVRKIRLTGGEPLLRKDLEALVEQLAQLRTPDGQEVDLTLTTNGILLPRKAHSLKNAGLKRVTVSLDALDDPTFQRMSDSDWHVHDVLAGIEAAQRAGLAPLKVNMVVQRGVNEHQVLPMARHFRGTGIELRFIEYMDVGSTNGWQQQHVVPSSEVQARIHSEFPLVARSDAPPGITAEEWDYADGQGRVGFISSVTQAFCGDCNRIRLSTEGKLYTCLFASQGFDLRALMRSGLTDEGLVEAMTGVWHARVDQYSQLRSQLTQASRIIPIQPLETKRIEMSYIGG